ncbi:MAG: hypothetical protein LBE12_14875, partial [Planctomycetaceae bacterium]|nr:hypothetical protein [Planctomycetaceae bacterium]
YFSLLIVTTRHMLLTRFRIPIQNWALFEPIVQMMNLVELGFNIKKRRLTARIEHDRNLGKKEEKYEKLTIIVF